MKRCLGCDRRLNLALFPPDRRAPDGKQSRCRQCINEWMREHYRSHPVAYLLRRAKARAARKGLKFALTPDDVSPLPKRCPVFGLKLHNEGGPGSYSLDRIDNKKGYVPGNVVVISYLANRLKNDGTAAQHRRIADWMDSL